MPRYIDIEPFETETGVTACHVQTTTHTGDGVTVKATRTRDIPTIDPESLRPPWRGEKGASPDDPPGPSFLEADKAVPAEKLGKLGKLMIPYKGCPRGQMGRMCDATLEEEALYMGVITDEDGGRWVPVNEAVLRELIEKAKDRPHGRWGYKWDAERDPKRLFVRIVCSACNLHTGQRSNYCPNCGAKMDEAQTTCGDCLYVELCETDHSLTEFSRDNPAYCKKFHHKLQHEDG